MGFLEWINVWQYLIALCYFFRSVRYVPFKNYLTLNYSNIKKHITSMISTFHIGNSSSSIIVGILKYILENSSYL